MLSSQMKRKSDSQTWPRLIREGLGGGLVLLLLFVCSFRLE